MLPTIPATEVCPTFGARAARRGNLPTILQTAYAEHDEGFHSKASTPDQKERGSDSRRLRWSLTGEEFTVARGVDQQGLALLQPAPVLEGRLYFSKVQGDPAPQHGIHFFTMDKVMRYMPFCADFGPFNLGMTHHFCEVLKELISSPKLQRMKIVYYTSPAVNDSTNAIFLLGAFLVLHFGVSPGDAWAPFSNLNGAVRPYRDATWVPSPYDLHVRDCWAGLVKAVATGLYEPATFDEAEYFYYDFPGNGDMHEVVKGKFFAFKGPTAKRKSLGFGRYTLVPSDYFDVFRAKNIRSVVRLNNREYDRASLLQAGFNHHDLFFTDCSTPSDAIVDKFLRISEQEHGALAVHCLAGLGRTGTLIGLWMMKHMRFTANECIAWLRIVRPGSVIGPQQQYLKDLESRMWSIGQMKLPGLGLDSDHSVPRSPAADPSQDAHASSDASAKLADMVTQGMHMRDQNRVEPHTYSAPAPVGQSLDGARAAQLLPPRKLSGSHARPGPPAGPAIFAHVSSQGSSTVAIRRSNSLSDLASSSGDNRHSGGYGDGTPTPSTRIVAATRPDGAYKSREVYRGGVSSLSPRHLLDSQPPGKTGAAGSASRDLFTGSDSGVANGKMLSPKTGRGSRGQATGVTCSADGLPPAPYTPTGKGLTAARKLRLPVR